MSPKLKFPLLMKFVVLLVDLKLHVSSDVSRDVLMLIKLTTVSRDPQCYVLAQLVQLLNLQNW